MLDISVAYNRYRFVGFEFLTWLWYQIDQGGDALSACRRDAFSLDIGNRLVLENQRGEGQVETISIKGDQAGLEEAKLALRKGALVSEMNIVYLFNDQEWRFTVKGENLCVSALRTPETGSVESEEDVEGAVLEKLYLYEQVMELIDAAYHTFIQLRVSDDWNRQIKGQIGHWIAAQTQL